MSFVDPEAGLLSLVEPLNFTRLSTYSRPDLPRSSRTGATEENPQDLHYGEAWAHRVVEAILDSPAWPRTLLIYIYDEHGGYYDHVPPPAAILPDSIEPD